MTQTQPDTQATPERLHPAPLSRRPRDALAAGCGTLRTRPAVIQLRRQPDYSRDF